MTLEVAQCARCTRRIIWTTSPTGAKLPLDARPMTNQLYALDGDRAVKAPQQQPVYVSHYTTCPAAATFTRRGEE